MTAFTRTTLKLQSGTRPHHHHSITKHRLWARDRLHSARGVELTRFFGSYGHCCQPPGECGQPSAARCFGTLGLAPRAHGFQPRRPTAASAQREVAAELGGHPPRQTHRRPARLSTAQRVLGEAAEGRDVRCCDGKASQHHDPTPAAASPQPEAGALVFSQRRGGQVELEVLVLEDTAGGRVTVGNAEQPVLFAAMAARQFCQESQLQDKTQTAHCPAA